MNHMLEGRMGDHRPKRKKGNNGDDYKRMDIKKNYGQMKRDMCLIRANG